ncbi:MAG: EFR1 family ferrodoxin [Lachnospiraceae bacterium]
MILYFSSTGNCKYVAERIANETDDRVFSISKCMKEGKFEFELQEKEAFGLIVPTYFGGFPSLVLEFLNKVNVITKGEHYSFFITTYGASAGNIGIEADKIFKKLSCPMDGSFCIKMVDNWIPYFDMNDKKYIAEAEQMAECEIEDVLDKVRNHKKGNFIPKGMSKLLQNFSTLYYNGIRSTKKFEVNESCVGCGLCEKQCPSDAIRIENGKPVWIKGKCTLCLGCVHKCPKNAIAYTKKTIGHGQYVNPNVEVDS